MFGVFLFLTYYLQLVRGYTPVQTGLAFLPMIAAMTIAAFLSANVLVPRIGPKLVAPLGMLIAAAGMGWMTPCGSCWTETEAPPALLVISLGMSQGTLELARGSIGEIRGVVTHHFQPGDLGDRLDENDEAAGLLALGGRTPRQVTDRLPGRVGRKRKCRAGAGAALQLEVTAVVGGVARRTGRRAVPKRRWTVVERGSARLDPVVDVLVHVEPADDEQIAGADLQPDLVRGARSLVLHSHVDAE